MFETFDHTADLGLRVRAKDLDSLFREAAQALIAVLVDNPASIEPRVKLEFRMEADDLAYLLFDWLREILYRFDGESVLLGRFDVQVAGTTLTATAWGEPLDRDRHVLAHEVKAITYHGLRVEQTTDGWLAEVIVDI
ncbi:MAG TPA: archease [Gemmataceae bacterium]|nr:archease [Gemmataceae bacterium]